MEDVQPDGPLRRPMVQGAGPLAQARLRGVAVRRPGVQFDDITNDWHTTPMSGRINASNPCSEYLFLDDTACNLSSINLMKFLHDDGSFDLELFRDAVRTMAFAMEIIVDASSYPTAVDRAELARLPAARARLREPRRAPDALRARLRLRGGPHARRRRLGVPLRRGLPHVRGDLQARRAVPGVRQEPRPDAPRDEQARTAADRISVADDRLDRVRPRRPGPLARHGEGRRALGLPERADLRHRSHRDDRSPDGLRHARPRAGALPRQDEEPRRRRQPPDGQPDRRGRAPRLGLRRPTRSARSSTTSRRPTRSRGRRASSPSTSPSSTARSPPPGSTRTIPPMGHLKMLGVGPAVPLGRRLQDDQPPQRGDGRGHREDLPRGLAPRRQVGRPLPRRLQGVAAVRDRQGSRSRRPRRPVARARAASRRAEGDHPPLLRRRPRRLRDRGPLSRRPPRRGVLPRHEGRLDGQRAHGLARDLDVDGAPARGAVEGPRAEARPPPVRAGGRDEQPEGPLREVDPRLRRPVARDRVPHRGRAARDRPRGPARAKGTATAPSTSASPSPATSVKFETKVLDAFSDPSPGGVREDAPSCHICGGIMVRSGTCYACTACGATSGCS